MIEQVKEAQVRSVRDTGPFTRLTLHLTFQDESEMEVSIQRQRLEDETATAFVHRMLTHEVATIEAAVEEGRAEEMDALLVTARLKLAADAIEAWEQPVPGVIDPYPEDHLTKHEGKVWVSLVPDNVWEPGVQGSENLWDEVMDIPT